MLSDKLPPLEAHIDDKLPPKFYTGEQTKPCDVYSLGVLEDTLVGTVNLCTPFLGDRGFRVLGHLYATTCLSVSLA